MGQVTPGTAIARDVQDGVDNLAACVAGRPPAPPDGGQERFQMLPLKVCEVRRVRLSFIHTSVIAKTLTFYTHSKGRNAPFLSVYRHFPNLSLLSQTSFPTLTKLIEILLLFLINTMTYSRTGSRRGRSAAAGNRAEGLLLRLLRYGSDPAPEERLRQIYITGGTGARKSTLLMNVLMADFESGSRGVGFLDFRGEMFDLVIARLAARYAPEELAERLLLFDLRSPRPAGEGGPRQGENHVVGFNPFGHGRDPYAQVMFLMDVQRQQLDLGVQTEELCRNLLLAMALSPERPPLTDIEILLTSPPARAALLAGVTDTGVQRFFGRFERCQTSSAPNGCLRS